MSAIDWPAEFERTDPTHRTRGRKFQATIGQTTKQIAGEMDRMGVEDWRASTASGGSYTKHNGLPKADANPDDPGFVLRWTADGEQFAVACDRYVRLASNVRAVYLWVNETRMRSQRPVVTGDTAFAAARLPPGDEDRETVVTQVPPHEILGVAPDAPDEVVEAAARRLKAKHHPDSGDAPDAETFKRVNRAEKALLDREGTP